jgi:hypothetical protein
VVFVSGGRARCKRASWTAYAPRTGTARHHEAANGERPLSVRPLTGDEHRLTRAYYLYRATTTCTFFTPIFFLYYQEVVGLGMGTVLWLQSWAVAVRAILDLPFGWSRRGCLLASAHAFAAGAALKSGADSALLFDALQRADRLDLYPRVESRGQAVVSLASGATAIVGGLLAAGRPADFRSPGEPWHPRARS